jgi:hypothetical protein
MKLCHIYHIWHDDSKTVQYFGTATTVLVKDLIWLQSELLFVKKIMRSIATAPGWLYLGSVYQFYVCWHFSFMISVILYGTQCGTAHSRVIHMYV